MTYPLVSVLVRSIDRNTLKKTLLSVTEQDYPHIEVCVVAAVANHSPLDVPESHVQFRLVSTETPLQRSAAANKALDLAQGVYALFLDDDDWIAPEHISTLVKALQQSSGFEVAYSRTKMVRTSQALEDAAVMGLPFDGLRLLAGNWMPLHSVLFSMRLRDLGCQFDEGLSLYEDWDFWLQAAQHSDFLFVPVVSAFYRIHDSSGVHGQTQFYGDASRLVYRKWRGLWSDAQLSALMSRVWKHEDLQQTLQSSREESLQLGKELQAVRASVQALLGQQRALKKSHAEELDAIFNSRSWRLTAPLRQALHQLQRWKKSAKSTVRVLVSGLLSLHKVPALLRKQGLRGLLRRLETELDQGAAYLQWIAHNEPAAQTYAQLSEQVQRWSLRPLVSVLMPTYNSPLTYLKEAVESVQAQIYPHWELCIADDASTDPEVRAYLQALTQEDPRVVLTLREKNGHISASSNCALASSKGEWVALLDHDDRLHPLALFHVVNALQARPDAQIVYSDEDKIDAQGLRFGPYFKGEYNRELMWAQNMISHLGCYRRDTLTEIGGFRLGFEGSQDYDLALRVLERCRSDQVIHVPHVLYHWRAIVGSTALAPDQKPYADSASRRALREHLARIGISAEVDPAPEIPNMNRVRPQLPETLPLVSILIPTRDRVDLLRKCVMSIELQSSYPHLEIVIVDNGSTDPECLIYLDSLVQKGIQVIRDARPFNYSALNNLAAQHAKGEFLCLMNNDIEILTPNWLEEMLSFAALPGIGAVGAKLWYPKAHDGLQHGGVVIGLGGVAGHAHVGLLKGQVGYFGRMALHHRLVAVTAACMLIRKSSYIQVGGLDESIAVAFNDVDFCLRLHQAGFACVMTPYAEMVHHESASRGDDLSDAQRERFMAEEKLMHQRWGDLLENDPFFSPNLSLQHSDFRPADKRRTQ